MDLILIPFMYALWQILTWATRATNNNPPRTGSAHQSVAVPVPLYTGFSQNSKLPVQLTPKQCVGKACSTGPHFKQFQALYTIKS